MRQNQLNNGDQWSRTIISSWIFPKLHILAEIRQTIGTRDFLTTVTVCHGCFSLITLHSGKILWENMIPSGFFDAFLHWEIGNANPEIPMLNRPAINIEMIWDYDRWCCPLLFVANIPIVEFSKNSSVSQPKNPQPAPLLLFHPWAKEGIFVKSSCLEILCPLPSLNKTSQLKYPW